MWSMRIAAFSLLASLREDTENLCKSDGARVVPVHPEFYSIRKFLGLDLLDNVFINPSSHLLCRVTNGFSGWCCQSNILWLFTLDISYHCLPQPIYPGPGFISPDNNSARVSSFNQGSFPDVHVLVPDAGKFEYIIFTSFEVLPTLLIRVDVLVHCDTPGGGNLSTCLVIVQK